MSMHRVSLSEQELKEEFISRHEKVAQTLLFDETQLESQDEDISE